MSNVRLIAKFSGYSTATVSRFINDPSSVSHEKRDLLFDICRKLNYLPQMVKRKPQTALLIDSPDALISENHQSALINRLMRAFLLNDLRFSVQDIDIFRKRTEFFDAVVSIARHSEAVKNIQFHDLPLISINEKSSLSNYVVGSAHGRAITAAVRYLKKSGHLSIAYIGINNHSKTAAERLQAFRHSHRPARQQDTHVFFSKNPDLYDIISRIPSHCTAVLLGSETLTHPFLKAASVLKIRIPKDLSLIVHESTEPPSCGALALTAIRQNLDEICDHTAAVLKNMIINHTYTPGVKTIPCLFIERQSVQKNKIKRGE